MTLYQSQTVIDSSGDTLFGPRLKRSLYQAPQMVMGEIQLKIGEVIIHRFELSISIEVFGK